MAIASQKSIPEIDLEIHKNIETATLCLGCFWGPDAEFGAMEGVLRTRVGYSGGELENPSYHNIGDHIETLQIDFDPEIISFREIAEIFWNSHNPFEPYWSRQYTKAIFYHNLGQKETIELLINDIELFLDSKISTEIKKFDKFYIAENYHQKYHLQSNSLLVKDYRVRFKNFADFINSTSAARVNGYVRGYGRIDDFEKNIMKLGLSEESSIHLKGIFYKYKKKVV